MVRAAAEARRRDAVAALNSLSYSYSLAGRYYREGTGAEGREGSRGHRRSDGSPLSLSVDRYSGVYLRAPTLTAESAEMLESNGVSVVRGRNGGIFRKVATTLSSGNLFMARDAKIDMYDGSPDDVFAVTGDEKVLSSGVFASRGYVNVDAQVDHGEETDTQTSRHADLLHVRGDVYVEVPRATVSEHEYYGLSPTVGSPTLGERTLPPRGDVSVAMRRFAAHDDDGDPIYVTEDGRRTSDTSADGIIWRYVRNDGSVTDNVDDENIAVDSSGDKVRTRLISTVPYAGDGAFTEKTRELLVSGGDEGDVPLSTQIRVIPTLDSVGVSRHVQDHGILVARVSPRDGGGGSGRILDSRMRNVGVSGEPFVISGDAVGRNCSAGIFTCEATEITSHRREVGSEGQGGSPAKEYDYRLRVKAHLNNAATVYGALSETVNAVHDAVALGHNGTNLHLATSDYASRVYKTDGTLHTESDGRRRDLAALWSVPRRIRGRVWARFNGGTGSLDAPLRSRLANGSEGASSGVDVTQKLTLFNTGGDIPLNRALRRVRALGKLRRAIPGTGCGVVLRSLRMG